MSRSQPASGPTISLFPFLAVLLCTMGALLVVLVLFSRAVKEGVVADAAVATQGVEQELELERDSLVWRVKQLDGVRTRTAEDLSRARMQLAGIEENARALEDEMAGLDRMAASLESAGGLSAADEAALEAIEARLASARESLDKARADQRTKPPAYAVVPYEGRNGTHRRPLYIECAGDGVFLQPENIRLGPTDFQGPPGPGNPLASALRAAREHVLASHGGANDPGMQPYPLLIVRPSGVMAYYAAREAIQSWGSDFGYQLVDEDWTLAFPPPDPTLAQVERRAIEESRQRLAWLAEVRPSRPAKQPRQYRAAPTRGGVVSDEGPSVLGDQSRWDWANGGADGSAGGAAAQAGRAGSGDGFGGGRGTSGSGFGSGGQPGADGGGFRQSVFTAGTHGGAGTGSGGPAADGSRVAGRGDAGGLVAAGSGPAGASGSAGPTGAANDGPSSTDSFGGEAAGEGDGSRASAFTAAGSTAGGGASASTGFGAAGSASAASGSAGGGSASASASAGGAAGPAMPGLAKPAGGQPAAAGASASMAQSRGKNWASLATQERPIPLTRPIRLECAIDEFRLMDDSGRRVQTRIPIDGDTVVAVDPLVKAVHARVDTWGLAGDRMYWKPVLVLSETSDGRSRREDLERLLADSGLDVRSSDGRDTVRPLPPVERTTAAVPRR
jgi:hypothetical protein